MWPTRNHPNVWPRSWWRKLLSVKKGLTPGVAFLLNRDGAVGPLEESCAQDFSCTLITSSRRVRSRCGCPRLATASARSISGGGRKTVDVGSGQVPQHEARNLQPQCNDLQSLCLCSGPMQDEASGRMPLVCLCLAKCRNHDHALARELTWQCKLIASQCLDKRMLFHPNLWFLSCVPDSLALTL